MNKRKRFEKLLRKFASLSDAERMAPENVPLMQEMYHLAPPELKRQLDAIGDRMRAEIGLKPSLVGADGKMYFSTEDMAAAFGIPVEEVEARADELMARFGAESGIHTVDPETLSHIH